MAQRVLPDTSGFTLQSVFDDALKELCHKLSPEDLAIITMNASANAVNESLKEALQKRGKDHDGRLSKPINASLNTILQWLDRNSAAIDMTVQSTPQAFGVSLTGLIWGALKFFIISAKDLSNTFDIIAEVFKQMEESLPIWDAYAELWGRSNVRGQELVETPLKQMQVTLVRFFLEAIKLLDRKIFKSAARLKSAYKSLSEHFSDYQKEIQRLDSRVDRGARVLSEQQIDEMHAMMRQLDAKMQLVSSISTGGATSRRWTSRNYLPQRLSSHFLGRNNELSAISTMLTNARSNRPGRCALWGIPGVGKSQLALKYGEEKFDEEYYSLCVWCSGTTAEKLTEGLLEILRRVNPQAAVDRDSVNGLIAVRTWLEDSVTSGCKRWLLIVDNVTESALDFLANHLPNSHSSGDILFTTRLKEIAQSLVTVSPGGSINVEELSVDHCVELLLTAANIATGDDGPRHEAEDFVKKVKCLPLAVEQAGAFVNERGGGMGALGEGLDNSGYSEVLDWDNKVLKYEQRSIGQLFIAIVKKVDSTSAESGKFLRLLCFLDTENISLDALGAGARALMQHIKDLPISNAEEGVKAKKSVVHRIRAKVGRSRPSGSSPTTESGFVPYHIPDGCQLLCLQLVEPKTRNQMADVLKNFSLASRINGLLTIHDLTRDVIAQHVRTEHSSDILCFAAQLISEAILAIGNPASPALWPQFQSLVPHLHCLITHTEFSIQLNKQITDAADFAGRYSHNSGRYTGAEVLYQCALGGKEKALGRDHLDTLATVNNLAILYGSQGKYNDAEVLYKRALARLEEALGQDHPTTLATLGNLAQIYRLQGKYDNAELLYKRALAGAEKALGRDHPDTLKTVHNLAVLYLSQGKYDDAEVLYNRALAGEEKALGQDHPDTLMTVGDLALLYRSQSKYDDAEVSYKRALAGKERAVGRDHPSTLTTVHNLAGLYKSQGKYDDAEVLYKRALDGEEKALGRNHPDTLMTVGNLAVLYLSQGKYDDAEVLYNRALAGEEKALGRNHPATLTTVGNLAGLYKSQGRYDDAEVLYKRVLAGQEKALGRDHPTTLATLGNLAGLYKSQGKYDDAEVLYKLALAGQEKALGHDHPDLLMTVNSLAFLYLSHGKYDDAEVFCVRALAVQEKALGHNHPSTLMTVNNLAFLYQSQGKYDNAEVSYKRALAGEEKSLGLDHPDTLMTVGNLAVFYRLQGKYDNAEVLYSRALAGQEKALGRDHPSTLTTVCNLAFLYRSQGKFDDAEVLYKRALAGMEKALGRDHPKTLKTVNNFAELYRSQAKYDDAEALYKHDLEGSEAVLGRDLQSGTTSSAASAIP